MPDMSIELDKETKDEFRQMSTSELAKRLSESSDRLEAGAEYSDEEIQQAQDASPHREFGQYDRARTDLMISDFIEQQASTEILDERKNEG